MTRPSKQRMRVAENPALRKTQKDLIAPPISTRGGFVKQRQPETLVMARKANILMVFKLM